MEPTTLLHTLELPIVEIEKICKKYYICKLSVFGSFIHGSASRESDVDVLVEFLPGHTPGFAFGGIENELSQLLDRKVDLQTAESLSKYFREDVIAEAVTIYAEN